MATSTNIPGDPLELALLSASACSFIGPPDLESGALAVLMEAVMVCPASTVVHIPRSVRPLFAKVLATELHNASSSLWGFVRLLSCVTSAVFPPMASSFCFSVYVDGTSTHLVSI